MNNMYISITPETIYRWFSGLFLEELSEEALMNYRQNEGMAFLNELALDQNLRPLVNRMITLLEQPNDQQKIVLDLAGEYARLFLGVAGQKSAPPYASAYLSEKGLLCQQSTKDTQAVLNDLGMSVTQNVNEPVDHISIQLNILAELFEQMKKAQAAGDIEAAGQLKDKLVSFLETQLLSWVPMLSDDCSKSRKDGFYTLVSQCLVSRMKRDLTELKT